MSFAELARRLTARAGAAASAHAELQHRTRREDPRRWHHARLLWPGFTERTR